MPQIRIYPNVLENFEWTDRTLPSQECEVGHGEGVRPVVVGRVPVAPPHHQHEPRKGLAGYPEPDPYVLKSDLIQ